MYDDDDLITLRAFVYAIVYREYCKTAAVKATLCICNYPHTVTWATDVPSPYRAVFFSEFTIFH